MWRRKAAASSLLPRNAWTSSSNCTSHHLWLPNTWKAQKESAGRNTWAKACTLTSLERPGNLQYASCLAKNILDSWSHMQSARFSPFSRCTLPHSQPSFSPRHQLLRKPTTIGCQVHQGVLHLWRLHSMCLLCVFKSRKSRSMKFPLYKHEIVQNLDNVLSFFWVFGKLRKHLRMPFLQRHTRDHGRQEARPSSKSHKSVLLQLSLQLGFTFTGLCLCPRPTSKNAGHPTAMTWEGQMSLTKHQAKGGVEGTSLDLLWSYMHSYMHAYIYIHVYTYI